jgi:carboxyl-terminal processing protease
MRYLNKNSTLVIILLFTWLIGCKEKNVEPETNPETNYQAINDWIYDVMDDTYFWYKQLPARNTLDSKLDPEEYFEKLVYQRTSVDRFSMVTSDADELENEFNGISKIFGISYSLSNLDETKTNFGLFLNYVVKGSPAELGGLKRGDVIMKVNGTQLTSANYASLLTGSETATFTLGTLNGNVFSANDTSISLTKAVVTENPVAFSTIIDKSAQGRKIGYVVYTQFVPGTSSDASKYDNELRQIFANFKSNGVNELVLDLRFNSGGYISSATTLASLIGKNASDTKVFYKEQWNDKYIAYWQKQKGANALNYNFKTEAGNIGTNLNRVFVLTSESTASASELVINGLKPYMEVITIGSHTAGKNLFSSLISDDKERWKWGVYVMLGQTANANGESDYGTINGITPTFQIDDSEVPFKAFGDDNETLFRKALDVMGVAVSTAGRISATKKVTSITPESYRDDLRRREKVMIKNNFVRPVDN